MATYLCPEGHASEADDWCDVCGAPIGAAPTGAAATGAGAPTPTTPGSSEPRSTPRVINSLSIDPPATEVPDGPKQTCPNCGAEGTADALFCEDCGYDFTTGQLPVAATPTDTGAVPDPAETDGDPLADGADGSAEADPANGAAGGDAAAVEETQWVAEVWVDPEWYSAQDVVDADPCPTPGLPRVVRLPGKAALIGRRSVSRNIHPVLECGSDTSVSRRHAELTLEDGRWFVEDLQSTNGTYAGPAAGALPKDPLVPGNRRELGDNDRIYVGAWTRIVVRPATPQERDRL